jgi:hypothetical protein
MVESVKIRSPKNRYLRLLKLILQLTLFSALFGFVLSYFWDYRLSFRPLTTEQFIARSVHALGGGLWAAISGGFPMWLVLEKFKRPKRAHVSPPAVPSRGDAQHVVGPERG